MFIRQRQALLLTMVSVCAVWMTGCSDESLDVAFSKKFMPETPTGVSAYANSSSSITVSWNSVSDAMGYFVYRSEDYYGYYTEVATTYSTSYHDDNLNAGTTYYYKVSAYNGSGKSAQSSYVSAATLLNAPSGISASASSSSGITVSWNSVYRASGYYVYRSTGSSGYYSKIGSAYSTSYTDYDVSAGTTYYYKVSAYNGNVESEQSSYAYATLSLNPPSSVSANANSSSSITVNWSSVSGAAGYYVYRSTSSSGSYSSVGYASSTSYTDNSVSAGTTYYYKVSAYNGSVESALSSYYDYATTVPSAPSGISAGMNSSSSISVSWYSVSGATGYYVYRSTSSSGYYSQVGYVTSYNSYTDYEVSAGTTYYYKVSAYNGTGESAQSSSYASATTGPGRTGAPSGVSVTATSASSITVSWYSVSGATGYYVYRSTSYSGAYSQVGSTYSTSYTDYNLSAGTTYYYKVSAYNGAGESSQSGYESATTVPSVPSGVSASASSSNSISISWYSVTGATGYYVYRSTSYSGAYSLLGSTYSASYTDNSVSAGTTYYYKVSAYNGAGESSQSSYTSVTSALSAPSITSVTATSASSIAVSWYSVAGATGYRVYRKSSSSGSYSQVGTTSSTTYTDNGVSSGTTYYYKVSAYNSAGESSLSDYDYDATTYPSAPSGVSARCEEDGIIVSWSPVTGATGYNVYRSMDNFNYDSELVAISYGTSYLNYYYGYDGLSPYDSYYYRVTAVNDAGESVFSLSSTMVGPCDY